jgi:flagellar hook protein FlgE
MNAQVDMQAIQTATERAMQQEAALEENIDFAQLLQSSQPAATTTPRVSKPSTEEQEMWENYAMAEKTFDAGLDHSLAAAEERKRLEKEATDFDLWNAADYLPDEGQNDSELLLDELEQSDILTEILQNTCRYISLSCASKC